MTGYDWSPGRRLALGLALYDVPFRWEPGPIIVVRKEGRSVVDAFFEESGTGSDGAADETDADDEDDASDGVESAMGDLFVCADHLVHAPWDSTAVRRLRELGVLVRTPFPPSGSRPAHGESSGLEPAPSLPQATRATTTVWSTGPATFACSFGTTSDDVSALVTSSS